MDVLKACWIVFIFLLIFFALPLRLFSKRANTAVVIWLVSNFVRMVLGVTVAVFLAASIKALTAITLLMLLAGALAAAWLRKHQWRVGNLILSLQTTALRFVRKAEGWSFGMYLLPRLPRKGFSIQLPRIFTVNHWLDVFENQGVLAVVFLALSLMSVLLLSQNALHQLRFDHAGEYSALLRARELLLNLRAVGLPFVFPAVTSATALIGATDLMQVTRFLFPVFQLLLVLAAGLAIRVCTRSGVAAIATMYCLGAGAFPPARDVTPVATTVFEKLLSLLNYSPALNRPGPELVAGLVFALLALVFLADWQRSMQWDSLLDVGCCLALVGIASQFLLIVLIVPAAALLISRPLPALTTFTLVCYGLAAFATFSNGPVLPGEIFSMLPLGAAIAVGCIIEWVREALSVVAGKHAEGIVFLAFLVLALVWLRPHGFTPQFLEFETTARQTLAISNQFPRQKWVVVAPVEQLPETFGFGGYEDLAAFIAEYQDRVANPDFRFPHAPDHTFIYVEKRPFQMFAHEPTSVSYGVLTDATFRNYRSPAGRASLETAALGFCETYRHAHTNMTIYFEDDDLRIYRVQAEPEPKK